MTAGMVILRSENTKASLLLLLLSLSGEEGDIKDLQYTPPKKKEKKRRKTPSAMRDSHGNL